jgi:hypothetical protein
MNNLKHSAIVAMTMMSLIACTGQPMTTQNLDMDEYVVIGKGSAKATGIMLLGFIPIGQNDRFIRAQNAAIERKGGDAMINTQVQESWFWAYILFSGYQTTVSGDVVKLKEKPGGHRSIDESDRKEPAARASDYEQLRKLKSLLDDEVITEEDYQQEKEEILFGR